jgi:hypothetical protein
MPQILFMTLVVIAKMSSICVLQLLQEMVLLGDVQSATFPSERSNGDPLID